jgi:beta-glucanase (GH16 family)
MSSDSNSNNTEFDVAEVDSVHSAKVDSGVWQHWPRDQKRPLSRMLEVPPVHAGSYGRPPKSIKAPGADFAADFQVIGGEWRESDNSIRFYINGVLMGPPATWPSSAPPYKPGKMLLTVAVVSWYKPNDTEIAMGPQSAQYDYVSYYTIPEEKVATTTITTVIKATTTSPPSTVVTPTSATLAGPAPQTPLISRKDSYNRKYKLAWSDTFDAKSLNKTNWDIVQGSINKFGTRAAANVRLSNGGLRLDCKKVGDKFVMGSIVSKPSFDEGFFEVKLRLPSIGESFFAFDSYLTDEFMAFFFALIIF